MNPLEELLARRIRTQGPLTVAEFMAEALGHPEYGYYATRDPLGRRGDFTTAPEISQVFGELIGLWCVDFWDRAGRPAPFTLAELGPGRGTLMADALRAARVVPEFLAGLRLHLVETSPVLRQTQHRALKRFAPSWHDSIASLPAGPRLLVANEFLDALPIRQLVKTATGWHEKLIGLSAEADRLAFALSPGPAPSAALVPAHLRAASPGSARGRRHHRPDRRSRGRRRSHPRLWPCQARLRRHAAGGPPAPAPAPARQPRRGGPYGARRFRRPRRDRRRRRRDDLRAGDAGRIPRESRHRRTRRAPHRRRDAGPGRRYRQRLPALDRCQGNGHVVQGALHRRPGHAGAGGLRRGGARQAMMTARR